MNKKEFDAQYYLKHRDKILERTTQYRKEHLVETKLAKKKHRQIHKKELSTKDNLRREKLKTEVLSYYCNSTIPHCIICNEKRLACLSIDHIDGGGNKVKQRGASTYYRLKREGYPEGYQTLCMNCQFIKRVINNECHRGEKTCNGINR